jgi:hypothetical protein
MTLAERMKQVQGDSKILMSVSEGPKEDPVLICVVKHEQDEWPALTYFRTNRFFKIGGNWEWSCDYDGECLEEAIADISIHFDIPKEAEPEEDKYPVKLRKIVQSVELCDIMGINPYCINEGANPDETEQVPVSLMKKYDII